MPIFCLYTYIPSRSVGDIWKGKFIFWNLHNSFTYYLQLYATLYQFAFHYPLITNPTSDCFRQQKDALMFYKSDVLLVECQCMVPGCTKIRFTSHLCTSNKSHNSRVEKLILHREIGSSLSVYLVSYLIGNRKNRQNINEDTQQRSVNFKLTF